MSHRRERVGHELAQRIAQIVERRLEDPRLQGLTVVEVRPSADLSFARVFYRTLADRERAARALARAKPFIRRCLAESASLRRVPELDFRYDPAADRAARVEQILDEIREDEGRESEEDPPGGVESST